ncbi:MAG TPA: TIGR02679 domain-containing protein [Propionicimonas sp.]|nr:TIGR02679 domain-containing protein [Propionicimonas sp.]HRA06671.1 TIGR02679 domain-containing protein [Propionicimonas sp.]
MTEQSVKGEVPGYLLEWAGLSGPARVLRAARDRLERRKLGPRATIAIELSGTERGDVGRLLTADWARSDAPVPTRTLRQELARHGCTLDGLLIAVGGPLRDRPAETAAHHAALATQRRDALDMLRELLGPVADDIRPAVDAALLRWVIRRRPPIERAEAVAAVVAKLPSEGDGVLLPVLAAGVAQDAHALDKTRPLGRAVARFLAVRAALDRAAAGGPSVAGVLADLTDPVATAEDWRAAWTAGGVACDTVSSQVLVLNLPLVGDAAAVRLCEVARGEPLWLTLRSLTGTLSLAGRGDVFVCENPSVVEAAADRLGSASAPLVCTFGRPGVAALRLLQALAPSVQLRLRADGDRAGWSIVNGLLNRFDRAERWRMPDGFAGFEEEILGALLDDLSEMPPDGA